jgi:alkyl hydroperoxide reductase subunit AhpF
MGRIILEATVESANRRRIRLPSSPLLAVTSSDEEDNMPATSTCERELIRATLNDLSGTVTLRSYTSDVDSTYSRAERALLEAIAAASPKISLEILADRWNGARERDVGIARTPAIVLLGDRDYGLRYYGLRYYGLPDGYELPAFLGTIRAVAERRSGLSSASVERLRTLTVPCHLEVFASPT